jgi:hypothetical protein
VTQITHTAFASLCPRAEAAVPRAEGVASRLRDWNELRFSIDRARGPGVW